MNFWRTAPWPIRKIVGDANQTIVLIRILLLGLYINVVRPAGVSSGDDLPVVVVCL